MIKELRKLEDEGLITLRAHDQLPLLIANYTPEVQYSRLWDEHELIKQCRGLIVDEDGNVVARPFEKFFNIEEHKEFHSLPDIPYNEYHVVYDKLDGSLGIIYWYKDKWRIASRGSFHSDQADKARELLEKYDIDKLDKEYTYLVEIIYPSNRIVIDYGDKEELILVAKIHTETGKESLKLSSDVFPEVTESHFNIHSLEKYKDELNKLNGEEKEGFVIHFISGLRIKIKLKDYVRLHRLMTGLTKRKVWELLKDGEDIEELYMTAPDEVYEWVEETTNELKSEYVKIKSLSLVTFFAIKSTLHSNGHNTTDDDYRKQFAMEVKSNDHIQKHDLQSLMFALEDGKNIDDIIWKKIYPEHETINTTK